MSRSCASSDAVAIICTSHERSSPRHRHPHGGGVVDAAAAAVQGLGPPAADFHLQQPERFEGLGLSSSAARTRASSATSACTRGKLALQRRRLLLRRRQLRVHVALAARYARSARARRAAPQPPRATPPAARAARSPSPRSQARLRAPRQSPSARPRLQTGQRRRGGPRASATTSATCRRRPWRRPGRPPPPLVRGRLAARRLRVRLAAAAPFFARPKRARRVRGDPGGLRDDADGRPRPAASADALAAAAAPSRPPNTPRDGAAAGATELAPGAMAGAGQLRRRRSGRVRGRRGVSGCSSGRALLWRHRQERPRGCEAAGGAAGGAASPRRRGGSGCGRGALLFAAAWWALGCGCRLGCRLGRSWRRSGARATRSAGAIFAAWIWHPRAAPEQRLESNGTTSFDRIRPARARNESPLSRRALYGTDARSYSTASDARADGAEPLLTCRRCS